MILYGIAPYCKVELLGQINSSPQFSLSFVEILNTALQKCQMDVNIRFFNNTTNMVVTRYLDCNFLERLNADNLFSWIRESIYGLLESKFLQLFLDSPSVNWVVLDKLEDLLVENGQWKMELLGQINSSPQFSLSFVEILNTALQKCQMDVNVRFFNNTTNMGVTRYLDCNFLERPNADNLFSWIHESISGLSESKFLQLFLDSPSVNWVVLDKLDDLLVENGHTKTVPIGSCVQHTFYGSFQTGIANTGWDKGKI